MYKFTTDLSFVFAALIHSKEFYFVQLVKAAKYSAVIISSKFIITINYYIFYCYFLFDIFNSRDAERSELLIESEARSAESIEARSAESPSDVVPNADANLDQGLYICIFIEHTANIVFLVIIIKITISSNLIGP